MKFRNVLLGAMLGLNVMTSYGATVATAGGVAATTAIAHSMATAANTINAVTSQMMSNSENTAIVKCLVEYVNVKAEGEWLGHQEPSMENTTKECGYMKRDMERFNKVHYKWGKAKGMFNVNNSTYVMMELVEVH